MAKCKCDFCKCSKRLRLIQSKLNKRDSNFIEHFVGMYLDTAQDLSHKKALLDGTWPESRPIHDAFLKWQKDRFKDLS